MIKNTQKLKFSIKVGLVKFTGEILHGKCHFCVVILTLRISFFNIMDNSFVTVLGFQYGPERDSLQEVLFKEDDENKTEHGKNSSRVNEAIIE